jgi:hypothetical protein
MPEGGPRAIHAREEVRRHNSPECIHRHHIQTPQHEYSGVVDPNVDPAKSVNGSSYQFIYLLRHSYISRDCKRLPTPSNAVSYYIIKRLSSARCHDDV